ncbi:MAG: hypothetical protein PHC34_05435, partial [Candidatus Gastranaerophilales bacterium]|nr:hypothetical protein [Candidatus Gastranaerophilales bacterium]
MKNLRKYPQNILLLLFFLLVCIVIIFLIKESTSFSFIKQKEQVTNNVSLPSLSKFKLNGRLILGNNTNPLSEEQLDGSGTIKFNLLNGDLK